MRTRHKWLSALTAACLCAGVAAGQFDNPVYVDDAPRAADALGSIPELVRTGNTGEAVRALQRVLDESAERMLADASDAGLYMPARSRVHEILLADADLLDRYRRVQGPEAAAALAAGDLARVERSLLLTRAGAEAVLRLAQGRLERGAFWASRRVLLELEAHPDRRGDSLIAERAARIAALQSRYLGTAGARELAVRWHAEAGLGAPEAAGAIVLPEPAAARSPMSAGAALDRKDLLPTPMASVVTTPQSDARARPARNDREQRQLTGADSWVFPTVVGDALIVNDGLTVSAYDRFTLALLWRAEPERVSAQQFGDERRFGNQANFRPGTRPASDTTSVATRGPIAVAATGIGYNQGRDGDLRVHGIDVRDGRVLWSVSLAGLER